MSQEMGENKMQDEFNNRCDGTTTQNECQRCGGDGTPRNINYSRSYFSDYQYNVMNNQIQRAVQQQVEQQLGQSQMGQIHPVEPGGIAKVLKWANQPRR